MTPMNDRFAALRGYGCVITATAEATARSILTQMGNTHVGVFASYGGDDEEPDDGVHLAVVTDDAYVVVCIDADGSSLLGRCSSEDAYYKGSLTDTAAAVQFLHDHQVPNNHPELGNNAV